MSEKNNLNLAKFRDKNLRNRTNSAIEGQFDSLPFNDILVQNFSTRIYSEKIGKFRKMRDINFFFIFFFRVRANLGKFKTEMMKLFFSDLTFFLCFFFCELHD